MTNATKDSLDMRLLKRHGEIMARVKAERDVLYDIIGRTRKAEAEGKDPTELINLRRLHEDNLAKPPADLPYTPESVAAIIEEAPDAVIRLALRLKYIHGLGWDDIAETVGRSPAQLKTACLRALRALGAKRAPITKRQPVDWERFAAQHGKTTQHNPVVSGHQNTTGGEENGI